MPAARKKWGTQTARKPPDGRIRASQLVTTFGSGALLDLMDDAVLVGGLDFWSGPKTEINDARLREAVAAMMQERNRPLRRERYFLGPPECDSREPTRAAGLSVYEFPRWFFCQNPRCRALVKSVGLVREGKHYVHECAGAERKKERCVPVRFVVACRKGHVDDVDWIFWVHTKGKCEAPRLTFEEGPSGDGGDPPRKPAPPRRAAHGRAPHLPGGAA